MLESALGLALAAACVVAFFAGMVVHSRMSEGRRLDRADAAFLRDRVGMTGDEFLSRAGVGPEDAAFFLAARRSMAHLCAKADEMIHPGDTIRALLDLQYDRGYLTDFVFQIEWRAGVSLPLDSVPHPPDDRTFVDFVRDLARFRPTAEGSARGDE